MRVVARPRVLPARNARILFFTMIFGFASGLFLRVREPCMLDAWSAGSIAPQ